MKVHCRCTEGPAVVYMSGCHYDECNLVNSRRPYIRTTTITCYNLTDTQGGGKTFGKKSRRSYPPPAYIKGVWTSKSAKSTNAQPCTASLVAFSGPHKHWRYPQLPCTTADAFLGLGVAVGCRVNPAGSSARSAAHWTSTATLYATIGTSAVVMHDLSARIWFLVRYLQGL